MNDAAPRGFAMRTGHWLFVVASFTSLTALTPHDAHGAGEATPAAWASASAEAVPTTSPNALPELPRLSPIPNPEPDPAALQELDRLLSRLTAEDARTRENARTALAETSPSLVAAVRHRVQDLRGSLDREAAPRVIEAARKAGRKALKEKDEGKAPKEEKPRDAKDAKDAKGKGRERAKDEEGDGGDWLEFLVTYAHPSDKNWQDVTRLVGMERVLVAIGTTPAVREMIALHAYFGDLLRIDLQRQVSKLRDKAVPALIEARQHDAKIVQRWANKELDALGRAIPGEAVASNDTQILADVLRAYGRTRDVDAVRVILSFSNSDRIQLREASREAIAAIGEPGIWQLRDQYLSLTGNKPPREWTWDRLARELFALYDRARLAEVYKLMDDGAAAASSGKLLEAIEAFDKVLARAPLFERRKEMVKAYVERATQLEDGHREDALVMMRKAWRLDPKGDHAKQIASEVAYLEGGLSVDRGAPDKTAFERALELDPGNAHARQGLAALEDKAVERQSQLPRYAAAGALGLLSLLALVLLARRRPATAASAPTMAATGTRPQPAPAVVPPSANPEERSPNGSADEHAPNPPTD
jgi:tetratricopeptide (TPR) repeat protein